jgi:hypothetical protein
VPFRDDHDAALQRIDALEADLKRTQDERDKATRERDRATRERDWLAADAAKVRERAPEQMIVVLPKAPLTATERETLLDALEEGAGDNRGRAWIGTVVGATLLFIALAVLAAGKAQLSLALGALGLLFGSASALQLSATNEARWRPVLIALRDAPTKILTVRRVSGRHGWTLVVKTYGGELTMDGDAEVVRLLERHCPTAKFEG